MDRGLRREVELTLGVVAVAVMLAVALAVLGGCGTHRQIATAQAQAPGPEEQVAGPESSPLAFRTTSQDQAQTPGALAPIYFDFDRHDIRRDQRPALATNGETISPGGLVTLEGHADERGTEAYNLALGLRRAYAVRNYLRDLGVPAEFRCVTFGEERPADPGHDEAAWARNRRVEFGQER